MEEESNTNILLQKYLNGTASLEEQAVVDSWYLQFPLEGQQALDAEATQADLAEIRLKLVRLANRENSGPIWYKIAAAAAILFILSAGSYFYLHTYNRSVKGLTKAVAKIDVAPGKNTATLTLANGRKIVLAKELKGKVAEEAGISIHKDADGQLVYEIDKDAAGLKHDNGPQNKTYNTLSTANGEQYQVNLPDGTKVWLNAASSLKYTSSFAGLSERRVELTGEAYFEVAKDKLHPFIVKTQDEEVKVLGTHFNINSYENEPVERTTLLEGSVSINNKTVLKPGQQSIVLNKDNIKVQDADLEMATAWKNGYFIFKEVPLQTIMRQISRWYDIEIIYHGALTSDTFNGEIDRKANLSRILKILEKGGVEFKLDGKKLIVTP